MENVCKSDASINSVTFGLHSTFQPNVVKLEKAPFEIVRQGWGSFDVRVEVETSDGKTHKFVHTLTLDKDSSKTHEIKDSTKTGSEIVVHSSKMFNKQDPQVDALISIMDKTSLTWNGPRMSGVSHAGMHGIMGDKSWAAPRRVVTCDKEARPGYNSMKAHEYAEEPHVLKAKIKLWLNFSRNQSFVLHILELESVQRVELMIMRPRRKVLWR